MANENYDGKYLRCDIVAVKDAGVGGRLFSAVIDVEIPNGVIGTMGTTNEDVPEIKRLILGVEKVEDMVIVMKPEINPDEYLKSNGALGLHRNKANKPVPVIKLEHRDRIALSEDYFKNGVPKVGDELVVDDDGLMIKVVGSGKDYKFVVTEIRNDKIPALLYDEDEARRRPIYKMITLELVKVKAGSAMPA